MAKVQTTCNYCSLACNLDMYVEGERITRILPTKGYPVNRGFACIKGLSLDRQGTVEKPLPLPVLREADRTERRVSWEEGIRHAAGRIRELQGQYGPQSVAVLSTGQLTLEEMALLGHVCRDYLKCPVDGNTRLCMATSVVAHKQSFGFDAPPYTLADIECSDTIIFIGANPVVAHPILWDRVRFNGGHPHKIIVIDPRRSETAENADEWYGIKPKSDIVLLYALANVLILNGWIDRAYIDAHTEGFEDFCLHTAAFTPEETEALTGISPERLLHLAALIHQGKAVSLWWTMGVNQGYQAVRTAQAIINIALMTGNMGRPGTGVNSLTGQVNAMGSRLFSNTAGLYGGGDYDNAARRKAVSQALDCDDAMLPAKPSIPYSTIIGGILAGSIKGLWILCTNPRHSWANNDTFRQAAEKLELFIAQDVYGDTDSSALCDIFFPVTPGIKKEGTMINTERRLSSLRPVMARGRDERSDFEVILAMGEALGMGRALDGWRSPREVFALMRECSRGMPCDITGISYDALPESSGIQWPFPEGASLESDQRRLFEDGRYYTPGGKARFMFEAVAENPLPQSAAHPYYLNTGRGSVGQWHTQTRTREVMYVSDVSIKAAYAYLNPALAREYGVDENEPVEICGQNGTSAVFTARLSEQVDYAQIYAPLHYIETNSLTPSLYDPYSKEPSFKFAPVSLRPVREREGNRK
jgi:assimilatory nitrate reductase catalytic subunit